MLDCNYRRANLKRWLNFILVDDWVEMVPNVVSVSDSINAPGQSMALTEEWADFWRSVFIFICCFTALMLAALVGYLVYARTRKAPPPVPVKQLKLKEEVARPNPAQEEPPPADQSSLGFMGRDSKGLPEGWVKYTDAESGNDYLYNAQKGLSIWADEIWEKYNDPESGADYFYNVVTQESIWEEELDEEEKTMITAMMNSEWTGGEWKGSAAQQQAAAAAAAAAEGQQPGGQSEDERARHWSIWVRVCVCLSVSLWVAACRSSEGSAEEAADAPLLPTS
mmetsp:Transcript_20824/g.50778  ORF Transcript_20824/g.50778 Transcript_20824/m.50778 type:complete len:280 (-) Transcript_20824:854-1693(-)